MDFVKNATTGLESGLFFARNSQVSECSLYHWQSVSQVATRPCVYPNRGSELAVNRNDGPLYWLYVFEFREETVQCQICSEMR